MDPMRQAPRVVGVYESEGAAHRAVEAATRAGVDRSLVRVGHHDDEVATLRGEMREEIDHAGVVPAGGPVTKGEVKGSILLTAAAAVAGAIVLLPLAAFDLGGLDVGWRILLVVIAGALMGATIGFLVGGALGARGPAEPTAAGRGVTVGIGSTDQHVIDALPREGLVRLDRIDVDGRPLAEIETEEGWIEGGAGEDLADRLQQTGGDWSSVREDHVDLGSPDERTHPDHPGANRPGRTG